MVDAFCVGFLFGFGCVKVFGLGGDNVRQDQVWWGKRDVSMRCGNEMAHGGELKMQHGVVVVGMVSDAIWGSKFGVAMGVGWHGAVGVGMLMQHGV